MTIEQMCCTREQSKRLRELGIDQKSYFYHTIVHVTHLSYVPIGETWDRDLIGSAWTVGELGMLLPEKILKDLELIQLVKKSISFGKIFEMQYRSDVRLMLGEHFPESFVCADTEAQVRAKMLIELLDGNVITAEEINKKLHE